MAEGFVWYELMTKDMDKAVAFYEAVVGWDVRDSGMPGMRYMLFGKDGKDVGGMMTWAGAGAPEKEPEWMGHIYCPKLDEEVAAVVADGGMVIRPATVIPGVGRFAVVLDPQKASYLLFEPGSEYAPPRLGQMEVGNVGWHELYTDDIEKTFDFYAKHYGWQKDYAHDMGPMGMYQTFRTNGPVFTGGMMSNKSIPGTPPHWRFYFTVEDVDAAQQRVIDAGGKVTVPPMDVPGGSRVMQAEDDQGGAFALTQPAKG